MSDGAEPVGATSDPTASAANADARRHSEGTTLVFAVTLAVALGIACGVWINSQMASAANAGRAAPSRVPPDTPPPADGTRTSQGSNETAAAPAATREPAATAVEGRTSKPAAIATPAARETSPQTKVEVRPGTKWEVEKSAVAGREQGRAAPCALYASAGSLTLRGGGAAPLVLGGPGEAGRVTVSTPDWSNIAVLYEGRAGNGWSRYTVRSVSGRPGHYTVRFATPCGSKTITVAVTR